MAKNNLEKGKNSFWMKEEMNIIKHPWFIIIVTLVITAVLFVFMSKAKTDNDLTRFLPDDNKERVRFQKYEYIFGSGSGIAISLTDKENANVYNVKMVDLIHRITKRVNSVNNVILRDILKKATTLKNKQRKILFNFLLTEMGKENFSLKSLKKDLTDLKTLARKLGVSINTSAGSSGADPDDVDTGDFKTPEKAPADPDDIDNSAADPDDVDSGQNAPVVDPDDEAQESVAITQQDVKAIVNHFNKNAKEIENIYNGFSLNMDKWNKYKSKWVDDVMSITDTDYAQGEFADKSKYYQIFKNAQKEQVDLLLTYLIEKNIRTAQEMKKVLVSKNFLINTVGLNEKNAQAIYKEGKSLDINGFAKKFRKDQNSLNYQTKAADLIQIQQGKKISKTDVELLKHRVRSWKFYKGAIVSYDEKSSLILIKTIPNILNEEINRLYDYIIKIVKEETKNVKNIRVDIAGEPVANVLMGKGMGKDLRTLFPFVIILVIIFLYLSFRHIKGVVLPLVTVIISVIWTIGFMAITGIPLSVMATTIPTLLVAVGSAYGIHLINDYYLSVDKGVDKKQAIADTLQKVGLAVFLAGLTTIVGFTSNAFNDIIPIREFGIFAGLGVFFALIISMTFIPALLRIGKIPKKYIEKSEGKKSTAQGDAHKILEAIGRSTYNQRWIYLVILVVLIVISIIGSLNIVVDMDNVKFFKKHTSLRQSDMFLNKNFGGTSTIMVAYKVREDYLKKIRKDFNNLQNEYQKLKFGTDSGFNEKDNYGNEKPSTKPNSNANVDPDDEGEESVAKNPSLGLKQLEAKLDKARKEYLAFNKGLLRPEFLNKIESIQDFMKKGTDAKGKELYPGGKHIGKIISINNMLKKFNQTMNYGSPKYYVLPDTVAKSVQYITTFFSENLTDYIAKDYRTGRMVLQMTDSSSVVARRIMKQVRKQIKKHFPGGKYVEGNYQVSNGAYEFVFTGIGMVKLEVNNIIVDGQTRSILFSLFAVFLIIFIAYKTFAGGLISMIPLGLTIIFNFGFMGFFGINLDASTALVASIAIGIGVDYTIHYINTFRAQAKTTGNIKSIIEHATSHSGRAILINAIAVTAGFLVLIFSSFNNIMNMGILVAVTMVVSSLASITFIPALLSIIKPKSLLKKKNHNQEVINEKQN